MTLSITLLGTNIICRKISGKCIAASNFLPLSYHNHLDHIRCVLSFAVNIRDTRYAKFETNDRLLFTLYRQTWSVLRIDLTMLYLALLVIKINFVIFRSCVDWSLKDTDTETWILAKDLWKGLMSRYRVACLISSQTCLLFVSKKKFFTSSSTYIRIGG